VIALYRIELYRIETPAFRTGTGYSELSRRDNGADAQRKAAPSFA
jgi:hypothetical protein